MKTYIRAVTQEVDSKTFEVEVGTIKESDGKAITEAESLTVVKTLVPMDAKTAKPVPVKYYHHVCYHALGGKSCEVVEIKV